MSPAALIATLRERGFILAADGDQLRFRGPREAVTPDLLAQLRIHKSEILSALRPTAQVVLRPAPLTAERPKLDPASKGRPNLGPPSDNPRAKRLPNWAEWPPDLLALVKWFRANRDRLPADPFTLRAGCCVVEPQQLYEAIERTIQAGPEAPCSQYALADDLAALQSLTTADPSLFSVERPASELQVVIGWLSFQYTRWRPGDRLTGQIIALDTETAAIVEQEIPPLALAAASDGVRHVLVHADDLGAFVLEHKDQQFVAHHASYDYWVVQQHLRLRGETEALQAWTQLVVDRRLHCSMLLDVLIRLAEGDGADSQDDDRPLFPRDLGEVTLDYTGLAVSKDDPYRLRFGEIIGADWEQVDPNFFAYAIKDPIATALAYSRMRVRAVEIMARHGYDSGAGERFLIYPDAPHRFGLLSETIQVEGAIALAQVTRNGLHTDLQRLHETEQSYTDRLKPLIERFKRDYPGIVLLDGDDRPQLTKTGMVRKSTKQLEQQLLRAVEEISRDANLDVAVPRTPKGAVSRSLACWAHLLNEHPFLRFWGELEKLQKRCQFFESLRQPVIRPHYGVLVRTGRTSCSRPNMQQIPREDEFRQIVVPSEGHLLLIVDYSFIELVTLAAVCQSRFGFSKLGDVIREGVDPHCYTAGMLLGVTLEDFMSWKETARDKFKRARQQAKPVNFGVPGGMGPASLVEYAGRSYGVDLTVEEAEAFHRKLTQDIYPELGSYLSDESVADLARQLRVPVSACSDAFCRAKDSAGRIMGAVRKVVLGQPFKKDGAPYKKHFVRAVWDALNRLNRNPDLADALRRREGSSRLAARLFQSSAVTLTGRVRGGTSYTQQRNTPFQSLASDGAKRALARLVLGGSRVVGFVHDEFLIEMPDEGGYVEQARVDEAVAIIRESMQEMTGSVPVSCEYALSICWSKRAELIVEDGKVWAWKPVDA
jgi:hypothetical protein